MSECGRTWAGFGAVALCTSLCAMTGAAAADTITITAGRDNTLYEATDPGAQLSNGAGVFIFSGATAAGELRRGLVRFDIAGVLPRNAIIQSVTLSMFLDKSIADPDNVSVHRVLADWGEGSSNAGNPGGQGAPAQAPDATWLYSFYNSQTWGTVGGIFDPVPSDTRFHTPYAGTKTWSSARMALDVQAWLLDPLNNFGWAIIGNESIPTTARRYSSRETGVPTSRPRLTITYELCKADFDLSGFVDFDDYTAFVGAFEAGGDAADFDGTGFVDFDDFILFVEAFEGGC